MKERPILFSGPMVRAILDGSKTQTRRIMKAPPINHGHIFSVPLDNKCPYGKPGDRLWVKETHAYFDADKEHEGVVYRESDNGRTWEAEDEGWKWRPSIFMFRKWSRIDLEITSIRVERLNDISEEDAKAEGVIIPSFEVDMGNGCVEHPTAVDAFRVLWESINGPGSWSEHPWVWVVEFIDLTRS